MRGQTSIAALARRSRSQRTRIGRDLTGRAATTDPHRLDQRALRAHRQPALLDELADVLARPKLQRFITTALAVAFIDGIATDATILTDPPEPPGVSPDPDDDYLIALARAADADYIVSGDRDLLDLTDPHPPVLTPRQFLDVLDA